MNFLRTITITAAAVLVVAAAAGAATIVGTPRNDKLRGTAAADKLDGRGGNDRLFGLAGNDVLLGGPGRDTLTGGPGADTFRCGPGPDVAVAGPGDRIGPDCETVTGLPSLGVADVDVAEGDAGTTTMAFSVVLSKPVTYPVTVRYATKDGTATAPSDYAAAEGTLSFGAGETTKAIEVAVVGDLDLEPNETIEVALSAASNATLKKSSAKGTITNEDVPRPRSGRYSGTTAQGRSISFDVSGDTAFLSNLTIGFDWSCAEVPVAFQDDKLEFGNARIRIVPKTWTFDVSDSSSDADGTVSFAFRGSLSAPGSAAGTFRFDIAVNTGGGTVHCSSGDVSWNAG
jgi:hypothetical protein